MRTINTLITGIEVARFELGKAVPNAQKSLNRLLGVPGGKYATDTLPSEGTVKTLVDGHNELAVKFPQLESRVAALEVAQPQAPFPASS